MSRDLMDENYYISHGGKIPVKWTAPEVGYIGWVVPWPYTLSDCIIGVMDVLMALLRLELQ